MQINALYDASIAMDVRNPTYIYETFMQELQI